MRIFLLDNVVAVQRSGADVISTATDAIFKDLGDSITLTSLIKQNGANSIRML